MIKKLYQFSIGEAHAELGLVVSDIVPGKLNHLPPGIPGHAGELHHRLLGLDADQLPPLGERRTIRRVCRPSEGWIPFQRYTS